MRIAGQYVGLGVGDSSDEIRALKAFLRRKFSYAHHLADSPDYDQAMFDVVYRMQDAYHRQGRLHPATGIVDWATKVACGYLKPPPPQDSRPVLFTVCGTGVPWWVGPDADTARAVEDRYLWQPVGYSARTFPMNQSVQEGRAELANQMERHRAQIIRCGAALIGYSQGAIVACESWLDDMLPAGGRLHWAQPYLRRAATFGNPMREQGRVFADAGGQAAGLSSHGIADRLMVDTPDWWRDYAHHGDIYTDCEGPSAEWKTAIYKLVMGARILQGPDSLLTQALELVAAPAVEVVAVFKAVMDAGLFFAAKTRDHVNYSPQAAVEFLRAA